MGLTRARVYQLLNEINDIMMVRWPTGRHQAYELRERFQVEAPGQEHAPTCSNSMQQSNSSIPVPAAARPDPLEQMAVDVVEQEDEFLEVS